MIRGNVRDRPWGKTLGALARRGVTGQLSLRSRNARFEIAFGRGLVIAAASSGSAESAVALAFRQGLITAAQVATMQGSGADWERLAEVLPAPQIQRLHRQSIAACVARSFVLDHGELTLDGEVTLRVFPETAAHVGGMIFHGARMYLGEQRLAEGVRALGSRFTYREPADLRHFGFSGREKAIVDLVLQGTSASLLDTIGDADERRTARAVVYALASCGVLHCEGTALPATPHVARKPARLARGTDARIADGTPLPRYRTSRAHTAAAAYRRGEAALQAGNLDEALPALERAHELVPDDVEYRCTLAWARFSKARDKASVADAIRSVLRHAVLISDRPVVPHYYLGLVEGMVGTPEEARVQFECVLAIDPAHSGALRQLA